MTEGVSGAPLLSVSGSVSVWRDASGGLLHSCNAVRSGASTCAAPRSTPTGGYAVGTAQGTVELLSASGAVERSLVASPGAAVRAICFDRQARYLWAAGEATKVVLFDLSDQARSTPRAALMSLEAPATSVALNRIETHLAVSTAAGHIVVYDLTTHRSTSLITETTQRISAIAFNPYRPKLLAAACEDGSVRLFDVAASLLPLHTFEAAHSASCTGLAFSTQYKMVMASVGLDDCIVLYDVEKKTVLRTFSANVPMVSVTFRPDGRICAGSTTGLIITYDLKQGKTTASFEADKDGAPVSFIASMLVSAGASATSPAGGPSKDLASQAAKPSPATGARPAALSSVASSTAQSPTTRSPTMAPLFGPRDGEAAPAADGDAVLSARAPVEEDPLVVKPRPGLVLVQGEAGAAKVASTAPPQRAVETPQPVQNHQAAAAQKQTRPATSESAPGTPKLFYANGDEPLPPLDFGTTKSAAAVAAAKSAASNGRAAAAVETASPVHENGALGALKGPATGSLTPAPAAEPSAARIGDNKSAAAVPSSPSGEYEVRRTAESRSVSGSSAAMAAAAAVAAAASSRNASISLSDRQMLVGVVEEAVERMRIGIHQDMQNMHLEILRQFYLQQREMEKLVKRMVPTEELLEELRMLREENERLRKTY